MNLPPKEGVGNAGCPLHPRPRVHLVLVERTRVTTSTPDSPDVPARNGLTVSFVLSPVIELVCHRRLRICLCLSPVGRDLNSAKLDASVGRQDHTTSPYAAASFVSSPLIAHGPFANPPCHHVARLTLPRPPHPHPRVPVTIAIRPLSWGGMRKVLDVIWGARLQKYFSENQK